MNWLFWSCTAFFVLDNSYLESNESNIESITGITHKQLVNHTNIKVCEQYGWPNLQEATIVMFIRLYGYKQEESCSIITCF